MNKDQRHFVVAHAMIDALRVQIGHVDWCLSPKRDPRGVAILSCYNLIATSTPPKNITLSCRPYVNCSFPKGLWLVPLVQPI